MSRRPRDGGNGDRLKIICRASCDFLPLTFIAGIYGMNFSREDIHGHVIPDNMPELYARHGYVYTLIGMFLVGFLLLFTFWKKGWFNKLYVSHSPTRYCGQ
ncbi:MAG: CorA family divalent cation transporter [Bacteroidota bacterium]